MWLQGKSRIISYPIVASNLTPYNLRTGICQPQINDIKLSKDLNLHLCIEIFKII